MCLMFIQIIGVHSIIYITPGFTIVKRKFTDYTVHGKMHAYNYIIAYCEMQFYKLECLNHVVLI